MVWYKKELGTDRTGRDDLAGSSITREKPSKKGQGTSLALHYGPEQEKSHLIIHFPTSLEVSEPASKRAKKRVAQYLRLDSCTIVY